MEQWIRLTFNIATIDDEEDGIQEVFCFSSLDSTEVEARLDAFLSLFGSSVPTLESLISADPEDTSGWHRHFDEWQKQGLFD